MKEVSAASRQRQDALVHSGGSEHSIGRGLSWRRSCTASVTDHPVRPGREDHILDPRLEGLPGLAIGLEEILEPPQRLDADEFFSGTVYYEAETMISGGEFDTAWTETYDEKETGADPIHEEDSGRESGTVVIDGERIFLTVTAFDDVPLPPEGQFEMFMGFLATPNIIVDGWDDQPMTNAGYQRQ